MSDTLAGPATAGRFTLDEARAAAWLVQAMAQNRRDGTPPGAELPELAADYCAAHDLDGTATFRLITAALEAGILTDAALAPDKASSGGLMWDYIPGSVDAYRWLLYGGAGEPILASHCERMSHLGGGLGTAGAESALRVLREAARRGNMLARQRAAIAADAQRLDQIARLLTADFTPDTFNDLADIVVRAGRTVSNYDPGGARPGAGSEGPAARPDVLGRLYDAAGDHDLAMLDELALRSGLLWRCPDEDCRWMNRHDEATCGRCGKSRQIRDVS
jgi:hypothetical protein